MNEIQIKRKIKQNTSTIILNSVIALIALAFLYNFVWAFDEISLKKEETKNIIDKYNNTYLNWFTYEDFKVKNTNQSLNLLLWNNKDWKIKKFYEEIFKKDASFKDYKTFLDSKEKFLAEQSNKLEIKNRNEKISTLIPNYQEWVYTEGNLTDLDFISYVESIIRGFSLTNKTSNISITSVSPLDFDSKDTLSSQIFYIPLSLELSWTSKNIKDFLHFARNIWQINIKWNNFDIDNDWKVRLSNISDLNFKNKFNIYNNHIFSVENIEIPKLFDINSSSLDEYDIKVELRFYVRGLPIYKIEDEIKKVVLSFKDLEKNIKTKLNDKNISSVKKEKIKSLSIYMEDLKKEALKLEPKWENAKTFKDNLLTHYKTSYNLKINIDSIKRILNNIK